MVIMVIIAPLRCTRSQLSCDNSTLFSFPSSFLFYCHLLNLPLFSFLTIILSGDEMYDVEGKGDKFMPFHRAGYDTKTGQVNILKQPDEVDYHNQRLKNLVTQSD